MNEYNMEIWNKPMEQPKYMYNTIEHLKISWKNNYTSKTMKLSQMEQFRV